MVLEEELFSIRFPLIVFSILRRKALFITFLNKFRINYRLIGYKIVNKCDTAIRLNSVKYKLKRAWVTA